VTAVGCGHTDKVMEAYEAAKKGGPVGSGATDTGGSSASGGSGNTGNTGNTPAGGSGSTLPSFDCNNANPQFDTKYMEPYSVSQEVVTAVKETLEQMSATHKATQMIGIPVGIFSAIKQNSAWDNVVRFVAMIGISFPPFFLAILLMIMFSLKIEWFPSMGAGEGFAQNLYHLVLPATTLGIILGAILMRFVRASMLEEVNQDYVRTARAKGVPEKLVINKHVLRNSLIPVITVIGLDITALLSGAILTETIYSRPGLGSMAVNAIIARDFPTLQGCLVLFTVLVVLVNLLVDISYSLVNPKIRPS